MHRVQNMSKPSRQTEDYPFDLNLILRLTVALNPYGILSSISDQYLACHLDGQILTLTEVTQYSSMIFTSDIVIYDYNVIDYVPFHNIQTAARLPNVYTSLGAPIGNMADGSEFILSSDFIFS